MNRADDTPRIDEWFRDNLRCPIDGGQLRWNDAKAGLISDAGRYYPVVDGVPVMLPEGVVPTLEGVQNSRAKIVGGAPWYLESVFLSDLEKEGILRLVAKGDGIDPVAAYLVAATNGLGYAHLRGELKEYPIPELRLPPGQGGVLLDIGCSWGRWCAAAARKGYQVVGIDPSLGAVMAARRVMRALGLEARFIVGDARHLPIRTGAIDTVFSYSVLQHFSVKDAKRTFDQVSRVLSPSGLCLVQMPTRYGLRCLYNQARRGFRETKGFEVRYWPVGDLLKAVGDRVGPAEISVDCFFGIGWQPNDSHLMPPVFQGVIAVSEWLRRLSRSLTFLPWLSDSVYVLARKRPDQQSTGRSNPKRSPKS
ncbi:MAG: methyltransferase domain-containing protein [Limisphaerales bacterium]